MNHRAALICQRKRKKERQNKKRFNKETGGISEAAAPLLAQEEVWSREDGHRWEEE